MALGRRKCKIPYADFPESPFPRSPVNKPSREMRQGSLCGMLGGASSKGHMPREGGCAVGRQGQLIAVVAFLIGCAVVLMTGASGVQAQDSKKEEARCEGTRTIKEPGSGAIVTTNDLPGCPKGGLLLGTEGSDQTLSRNPARPSLYGGDGDDTIRGLGGNDDISPGSGDDVVYGGDGDDDVFPDSGNDVIYGGDGNDMLASNDGDGQGDKLYCGAGRDKYFADPTDNVDTSCETASAPPSRYSGDDTPGDDTPVVTIGATSASASPIPVPESGGPAILLPTAALLVGSGILTYAILRRR